MSKLTNRLSDRQTINKQIQTIAKLRQELREQHADSLLMRSIANNKHAAIVELKQEIARLQLLVSMLRGALCVFCLVDVLAVIYMVYK